VTSSPEVLKRAVVAAALALERAQDELCRLDSVAGDGDEGLGMARAGRAIRERLSGGEPRDVGQIVDLAAAELSSIGGAMGAISYVIVSSIGDSWRARDDHRLTAAALAELLAAAEDAVTEFGGAKRGDKSILDSIAFARDAAEEAVRRDAGAKDATIAAVAAAREGAEATADMEARVGRASRLGSRSRGSIDAGAQSFAIALAALAEVYVSGDSGEPLT
jgi:dihydroxyacetone kinase